MNTEELDHVEKLDYAEEVNDIEELDHDGDAVLVVEGKSSNTEKFLVSSKVLGLASPMFAVLFSRKFSEGRQMIEGNRPEIILKDDDPAAMRRILRIFHFKDPGDEINPKMLALLAIHCDKYACARPLVPWVQSCSTSIEYRRTGSDYGFLLLAAHFFRIPELFALISEKAQTDLLPDAVFAWETDELLSLLPHKIIEDLTDKIKQLLDSLHLQIQFVERHLRNFKDRYEILTRRDCYLCGRSHPAQAKMCHTCKNAELHPKYCTVDSRVAEYFDMLTRAELWPSVAPFNTSTPSNIALKVSCANFDFHHYCEARSCPLKEQFRKLDGTVQILIDTTTGLSLYPLYGTLSSSSDEEPEETTTLNM